MVESMHEKKMIICFTGRRSYQGQADEELRQLLRELYERGARSFLCGMSWGFDLAAGRLVAEMKSSHSDVELVAVEPFADFGSYFRGEDAALYERVIGAADRRVLVSESENQAYRLRNDYMVDHSSLVVAWWEGLPKGGTAYTVARARKKGLEVVNLYPDPQLEIQF